MNLKAIQQIRGLLDPYRKEFILSFILAILPSYFLIWTPFLIGQLVDRGLIARDTNQLLYFGCLILFCRFSQFIFKAMSAYCLNNFALQLLVDYRNSLLQRVMTYPFSFFDKTPSGFITTRLNQDISSLHEFFSTAMIPLLGNLCLILGGSVVMIVMDWKLAIACLAAIPLFIWLTIVTDIRIRQKFGFMRRALSSLNSYSAESFSGARDIQVFGAQQENEKRFEFLSRRLWKRNLEATKEYAFYNPLVPFITGLMDIAILALGGWLIYKGQTTVGHVVAFLSYASYFGWPIREFSEKLSISQQASAAVDRLIEFGQYDPETNNGHASFEKGSIEFENVSFRYRPELPFVLKNINLKVQPGEKIALLGETGSGKTTTCSLLLRFYSQTEGRIKIGNQDIENIELGALRSRVSWVSQDVNLFSESLRDNISFFDSRISDEKIWKVLEMVELADWVRSLPGKLDEILTERGTKFSAGQKQILALARALVTQPDILIFDEATSTIDSRTEAMIQKALEHMWLSNEFSRVTTFIIAHRLSTLRKCDRLYVYKSGEIVESGTYQEVLERDGYGASLFQRYDSKVLRAS